MSAQPYNTFISYATEDEGLAEKLAEALNTTGFSVWFAPLSLKIGDRLLDSINAGLILSTTGLLILSPSYITKKWTHYELDVLHRQHIEEGKRLLPLWHRVTKQDLDAWNPGVSGIVGISTEKSFPEVVAKIVARLTDNAPLRGVSPSWESPYWRFLQGRGELNANSVDGSTFNIFEAVLFKDQDFPIYIDGKNHTREELLFNVAEIMAHQSYEARMRLGDERWNKIRALCIEHGFDPETMG